MYITTKALTIVAVAIMMALFLTPTESLRKIWTSKDSLKYRAATSNMDQPLDEEQVNEKMGVASMLYEGDIVLTKEQKEILEGGGGQRGAGDERGEEQAWRDLDTKWPGGVMPFVLDGSLSGQARGAIYSAMDEIKQQTGGCISFKMRERERDYVRFLSSRGCWSRLGRLGGRQDISIQNFGCATKGIVTHEIFHALGRFHEQNRPDRNQYVNINFNNIQIDKRHNFKIRHNAEDHDLPYDFGSIMHYGTYDFAINRRVPIITAKGGNSIRLGQRSGLSTRDIAHLKMAYCNGNGNNGNDGNNGGLNWWSRKK